VIRKIRKLRAGDRIRFEVVGSRGGTRKVTLTLGQKPATRR